MTFLKSLLMVSATLCAASGATAQALQGQEPPPEAQTGALPSPWAAGRPVRLAELPKLLGLPVELTLPERAAGIGIGALSLQDAIAKGVNNSLDVQATDARRESFDHNASAARGALLPRLDARAAIGKGRLESVDPYEQRPRKEGNVTLRQPLFDTAGLQEYRRQGLLATASAIQLQAAESTASVDVASAYLQATQVTLNIELSRGYEKRLLELQEYITQRAQAGGASNAERDRVKARVANARSGIADAKATLRTVLRNLESLIGEPPGALLVEAPAWLRIPSRVQEARDEAEQSNHDLRVARAEAEATAIERTGAKARLLPRMDLEVTHTRNLNGGGTSSYIKDTKAMVVLNWSLLNGGSDWAQARAVGARAREKQLRADEVRRKLWQELESAYANLDAVVERYDSLGEELRANQSVVDAFFAQLEGGNRSLLDVLDALQRLHQSRLDLVQLALGEMQNRVKVAHLTGRLASAAR